MGNWRRVQIVGTCDAKDVPSLREALTVGRNFENFLCLSSTGGICGLPNWAAENIDVVGNLAERGYDEESVEEALVTLKVIAPSLAVRIHVGGENESADCIATVVLANGETRILPVPDIDSVPPLRLKH
jgi:hypothetical protein